MKSSPTYPSRLQFAGSQATTGAHEHFALVYESRAEQLAVVSAFIREGLERGERCLYAAAENTESEIREALRAAGVEVDAAVDAGRLTVCDARELYLGNGEFSPESMREELAAMATEVSDETEYAGLRMSAELTWLEDAVDDPDRFLNYEAEVNRLYPDLDLVGLCQYDRRRLPEEVVDAIVRTHPILTGRETVTSNPYYVEPDAVDARPQTRPPGRDLDVLERLQRRERGLRVLARATPRLLRADRQEIPETAVTALRDAVQLPVTGLWLYDSDADELRLRATAGRTDANARDAMAACEDLAWHAYRTDETRVCTDLPAVQISSGGSLLEGALFVPVSGWGVVCVGAPTTDGIDATAVRLTETLAANARAALARAECETRIEAHREELRQHTTATRLFRETCRAVVDATTRSDVEAAVCEVLAGFDDVDFAWIGARGAGSGELSPREWAGAERGYLSEVRLDEQTATPAVRAAESGSPVVVGNVVERVDRSQWRSAALARDFRSVISVPLAYDELSYGVLTLYATDSGAFDGLLRDVLTTVGRVVAAAIHFAEQTAALHEPAVQELEFEVTASNFPLLGLAERADCALTLEGCRLTGDDRSLLFVSVEGTSRDQIRDAVDDVLAVEEVEFLPESGDGGERLALSTRFVGSTLAEHGAALQTVTADPSSARVVVNAPTTVATQAVTAVIDDRYPDATLVAKRQRDQSLATATGLQTRLLDRLTDRQFEVLTAAYRAGYFESPRESTGEEVAEMLGITAQTFSQHLRGIQRKLFDSLLSGGNVDPTGRD